MENATKSLKKIDTKKLTNKIQLLGYKKMSLNI